jgi:cytochrome c-type biogenesis protein CcmH
MTQITSRVWRWLTVAALVSALASPVWAQKPDVKRLSDEIICTCGCGATLNNCQNSMTCDEAVAHKAELQAFIDQGLTRDQIFARMVDKYGETILAAPTKRGFNLTAWIMPFAAMLVGGFLVVLVVRKWTRGGGPAIAAAPGSTGSPGAESGIDPELDERIERELRQFGD